MILYKLDDKKFSKEDILENAKFKGYQEKITQEQDILDEEGNKTGTERVEVDNPETPIDYIGRVFKEMADNWVSERLIRNKKIQLRNQEKEDIETIKSQVALATKIEKK